MAPVRRTAVLVPATASADSGAISNVRVISGPQLEATYTATSTTCPESGSCTWFPFANQVPASSPCNPADDSHLTWVGPLKNETGTAQGTERFYAAFKPLRLCLYIYHGALARPTVAETIVDPPEIVTEPPGAGIDYNCSDFATQGSGTDLLQRLPGDPSGLDTDGDGIACVIYSG